MIIANKTKRGFWFFAKYKFYLVSDNSDSLIVMKVDKKTWLKFNTGDYFDDHYHQFYTKEQASVNVK